MTRVAVLGTRFTMAGPVYRRALPAAGIEPVFPNGAERADIDRIIFDELVEGVFSEPSQRRYIEIIDRLKREEGCDGVARSVQRSRCWSRRRCRPCRRWIRRDCWRAQRSMSQSASAHYHPGAVAPVNGR